MYDMILINRQGSTIKQNISMLTGINESLRVVLFHVCLITFSIVDSFCVAQVFHISKNYVIVKDKDIIKMLHL